MLLDLDIARNWVIRCCAVGKYYAPVVGCVLLECRSPFWVGYGPIESDSLWAEGLEVVKYRLEKGEFSWVLRERGNCALDYVRDGFAVREDDVALLGGGVAIGVGLG